MPDRSSPLPVALIVGALLPVGMPAAAEAQGWPSSWTAPREAVRIADELYWVGTQGLAALLIETEDGHILIDVPMEEGVDLVAGSIRSLGLSLDDVELLLASHAHFDHVGGVAEMAERTGAEVVMTEADGAIVARGGAGTPGATSIPTFPAVAPDRIVGHLDTVTLGSTTLTAHVTAGHTPGCTTWSGIVHVEGRPTTFVSVCSLTVLPGYRLVGSEETYPGIGEDFCRSVRDLRALTPDIFLAPHGSFFGLDDKAGALAAGDRGAFVDPDRYVAYLDQAEESIERTLAEQGLVGGCATLVG